MLIERQLHEFVSTPPLNDALEISSGEVASLLLEAHTCAELRCRSPWEVRGAYAWVSRLRKLPRFAQIDEAHLMSVAPVVGEIRSDKGSSLGVALREISEIRVRRLLACNRGDELRDHLIRSIRLLRGEAPVADIIETFVYWGDVRRRKIARDYFSHAITGDGS